MWRYKRGQRPSSCPQGACKYSSCPCPVRSAEGCRAVQGGAGQGVHMPKPKPGQVYFCACRILCTHYISFLLVVRAVAPFVSQAKRPPWQGVWVAATINTGGMRSLEWRRPLLHANPLGHRVSAYLPKGCTLHESGVSSDARCGARCVSAPSLVTIHKHLGTPAKVVCGGEVDAWLVRGGWCNSRPCSGRSRTS